jgi:DNA polymerase III delta subunit
LRKAAPGVRLITGGREFDSYRAEEALESALCAAVGEDRTDAVEVFRGEDTNWARVVDAARTPSLFAPRRALVVRGAEGVKGDESDLLGLLADPPPGVLVILLAPKVDRRRVLWKKLFDAADVTLAEPLKGRALRTEVMRRVSQRGLNLAADGLDELIDRVGQDLRRVMGEIDKLEAFGFGPRAIGSDDVARVLGRGLSRPLWEMADALWERRVDRVLALAEDAVESGEAPLRIVATLHRSLRTLRAGRALQAQRLPAAQLAARLQVMPFKVEQLQRSLRLWAEPQLRGATAALLRADRTLKSQSGIDPRVVITAAVAAALGGGSVRPSRPGR